MKKTALMFGLHFIESVSGLLSVLEMLRLCVCVRVSGAKG